MSITALGKKYKCRICNAQDNHSVFDVREMLLGTRQEFKYFQCASCHTLQIDEIPKDLSPFYPEDYKNFEVTNPFKLWLKGLRLKYTLFKEGWGGKLLVMLKGPAPTAYFLDELKEYRNKAILDVGCGHGSLLREMHYGGFTNLTGIDLFNKDGLLQKKGIRIMNKGLPDIDQKFDVIMFHHSLEHVPNIIETLEKAKQHLNTNGRIVIRMPVLGKGWDQYRENWIPLEAPRHLHIMTPGGFKTLTQIIGLKTSKIIFDSGDYNIWASEQYKVDIPLYDERSVAVNPSKSIFTADQLATFKKQADEWNAEQQGDTACFILKNEA